MRGHWEPFWPGFRAAKTRPWLCSRGGQCRSVAALQGVLQSGNYYVPIDEQMPEARMRRILAQVHARAIVFPEACRPQAERLADCAPLVCLEEAEKTAPDNALLQARREQIIDLDPVYLLFTSGSTGTPKGIVISHRAILDFTDWLTDFCGYTEHEVFGNQSPFYFDTSCKDLYQTLKLGATCVILEKKFFALPLFLLQALDRNGVTAVNWATSAFHLAASSGALEKCVPHALRKIVVGGEALQARYVNMWKRAIPEAELYNMYGPTETTVDCAALHLTHTYRDDEPIPIGRACRNHAAAAVKGRSDRGSPRRDGRAVRARLRACGGIFCRRGKDRCSLYPEPALPRLPRHSLPHGRYGRAAGGREFLFSCPPRRADQAHGLPHRTGRN
ncbi:MAG: AMP-binding protein [Acutalibacteraceae bacterium]